VREQSPALASLLDPASRLSIKRFLCTLALFLVWAQVPTARSPAVNMALMALCAAAIEAVLALLSRESCPGPSLNRWDIAAAFVAVFCISGMVA
jgi:hypothetical protein